MKKIIYFFVFIFMMVFGSQIFGATLDQALKAYQDMKYKKAYKIAKKFPDKPVAQLVLALCNLHDKKHQDVGNGLKKLKELYNNARIDTKIRVEAGLSYARMIQLFQEQNKHKEYKSVKIDKIYTNIINLLPTSLSSCIATTYRIEPLLMSADKKQQDLGFTIAENFLSHYKGNQKNTISLHLFLEKFYINLRNDYIASFKHLKEAYDADITMELQKEIVLFRLGRISEVKLKNKTQAIKYYNKFLKVFPYSNRAVLVRRYLKNINR